MLPEQYLELVCRNLPVIRSVIDMWGELSLGRYLREHLPNPVPSYQARDDLIEVVYGYVASLLGETLARDTASQLRRRPVVVTTNHHGVDTFSQTTQGNILFALSHISKPTCTPQAVIFSCGNVPLNSSTYPRGLLIYRASSRSDIDHIPLRVPIFPDRLKRTLVAAAEPITEKMIHRTRAALVSMANAGRLSRVVERTVSLILDEDYGAVLAAGLPTYSDQAVVINNLVFKRFFPDFSPRPQLVNLEIERISAALLQYDINKADTLSHQVLFDPAIRGSLIHQLDGVRGCWHLRKLEESLRDESTLESDKDTGTRSGTMFFWGIDESARRIPLYLEKGRFLIGRTDRGTVWKHPFSPERITEGLKKGHLLPSLFMCFLSISFARGMVCLGGYFQGLYLTRMRDALVSALGKKSRCRELAELVRSVPTQGYLDSMLFFMAVLENRYLVPAGPIEIISGGGIKKQDIDRLLGITLKDAHLAAISETAPDAAPFLKSKPGWRRKLAADLFQNLTRRILTK